MTTELDDAWEYGHSARQDARQAIFLALKGQSIIVGLQESRWDLLSMEYKTILDDAFSDYLSHIDLYDRYVLTALQSMMDKVEAHRTLGPPASNLTHESVSPKHTR